MSRQAQNEDNISKGMAVGKESSFWLPLFKMVEYSLGNQ